MNADQLKAYKREKSRLFNAKMRDLRLKDKENKKIADQQGNLQGNQPNELSLQDLLDIFSTLDTKMDIIQTKLETIMETKMYETLDTKLDLIQTKLETIIETKLETKLETNQPQPNSIFFA